MSTSSYATLDPGWKAALASLHDDYFFHRQVAWPAAACLIPHVQQALLCLPGLLPAQNWRRLIPPVKALCSCAATSHFAWAVLSPDFTCAVVQDALWRAHALKSLPALMRATQMLVCGEDLGMIPACVHPVMEQLGLVGAPEPFASLV